MIFYKIIFHINAVLKKMLLKLIYGKNIKLEKGITFRKRFNIFIEKTGKLEIGKKCFFNNDCSINVHKSVNIGENCIFGENVKIYDHNHIFKYLPKLIKEQGFKSKSVEIGKNCWICSNVVILSGVKIGDNSIIGAGCVINENIESNMIVRFENNLKKDNVEFYKY